MIAEMEFSEGRIDILPGRRERRGRRPPRIYLIETRVAGFQYHDGPDLEVQAVLAEMKDLVLVREPYNEYDSRAIAIQTAYQDKVGFIPRRNNLILASMMDQGLPLFAEIVEFDPVQIDESPWNCLRIRVYMIAPRFEKVSFFSPGCARCGAPLNVNELQTQVRCEYCGSLNLLV